ncbi:MAG TPA: cell division protein SepF [Candidatus Nanoarchaeia archaeon]|nr:cell division protein SepF [Candidatus Nanoarchaeia archaeon]
MVFDKIKKAFTDGVDSSDEDYLEIDFGQERPEKKVVIKLFDLKQYEDVNDILNSLREGYTIAVIDMRILKQKDSIELKRAITKVKKTIEALEGNIAGFGENLIIATPSFATINKMESRPDEKKRPFDY